MHTSTWKANGWFKRQVALFMALVMAISCFASTGMVFEQVQAESDYVNDYAQRFIDEAVAIAASGTPYVWGGWSATEGKSIGSDSADYFVIHEYMKIIYK
ncbi:MAG: hypothetical protein LUH51_00435 [Firmicutes bacterium]|nr:hypothetical protein [Bacillota bacterium]